MAQAKTGDTVKVDFTGKLEDGQVFGSTEGKDPLEFKIGEGKIIPGIENEIQGMNEGDKKTVNVSPDKAYGPYRDELIEEVEKEKFPTDVDPEVGQAFEIPQPQGQPMIVRVTDIKDDKITLDGNHPLAGKDLVFELELLEIE